MIGLHLKLDGDGAWPDLQGEPVGEGGRVIHLGNDAPPMELAVLAGGMASGDPSVAFRIDLPDGRVVVVESSARLLVGALVAIVGRYPDLLDDGEIFVVPDGGN